MQSTHTDRETDICIFYPMTPCWIFHVNNYNIYWTIVLLRKIFIYLSTSTLHIKIYSTMNLGKENPSRLCTLSILPTLSSDQELFLPPSAWNNKDLTAIMAQWFPTPVSSSPWPATLSWPVKNWSPLEPQGRSQRTVAPTCQKIICDAPNKATYIKQYYFIHFHQLCINNIIFMCERTYVTRAFLQEYYFLRSTWSDNMSRVCHIRCCMLEGHNMIP